MTFDTIMSYIRKILLEESTHILERIDAYFLGLSARFEKNREQIKLCDFNDKKQ